MQSVYSGYCPSPACFTENEISLIHTCTYRGTQIITLNEETLKDSENQKCFNELIPKAYKYAKIWKQKKRYSGPVIFEINKVYGATSIKLPEGEERESLMRYLRSNGVNLS